MKQYFRDSAHFRCTKGHCFRNPQPPTGPDGGGLQVDVIEMPQPTLSARVPLIDETVPSVRRCQFASRERH